MTVEHRVARLRPIDETESRREPDDLDRADALMNEVGNVMNLLQTSPRDARKAPKESKERKPFDLGAALDMVIRAAEAMDVMERRSQEVQAQAESLVEQAKRDLLAAHERIASLQQRVLDALAREEEMAARLEEAEERAREADEWLARFHDTITDAFSARRAAPNIRKAA